MLTTLGRDALLGVVGAGLAKRAEPDWRSNKNTPSVVRTAQKNTVSRLTSCRKGARMPRVAGKADMTTAAKPRGIIEDKGKKIKETPDLTIGRKKYKMDLVPPALIGKRYFAKEQAAIDVLQAKQETAGRELEEFVEAHTGEESLLEDATNDKGKVTKGGVKDQLKAIEGESESDGERDALIRCLELIETESAVAKAVNNAQAALDAQVLARYAKLTEAEFKTLVVEDKWFVSIRAAIEDEMQRMTRQLAGRVKELDERYAQPLPVVEREVKVLDARVDGHLKAMGLVWE